MGMSRWGEVEEKFELIEAWCRDGLTEEQIAHNLGIGVSTLSKYKVEHIELIDVLKRGKQVIDYQVESQLLKKAMGYTYTEVKTTIDESGKEAITTTIKEVAPDTTAQIFWLKNRKPREWRDKQDVEHSGGIGVKIIDDIE